MDIFALFPVAVARKQMELTDKQREYLYEQAAQNRPNIGNKTSINSRVLESDELKNFNHQITQAINEYFSQIYAPVAKVELYITQSWLNVTRGGEFHHKHTHPGSLISGVYYIETTETDKITFSKQGHVTLDFPPNEFNQFNSPSWWLPATQGELLIFPSNLEHCVPVVEPGNMRISLSFNTWFYGAAGSVGDMTLLEMNKPVTT